MGAAGCEVGVVVDGEVHSGDEDGEGDEGDLIIPG